MIFYPLLLVSNLFVPTGAFPGWLQPIVQHQPLSRIADALRALSTSGPLAPERSVLIAVAWMVAIFAVAAIVAPRTLESTT